MNTAIQALYDNLMSVVSVKFVLIMFVALAITFVLMKAKPWLFLLLTGAAAAVSYALISHNFILSFWGLVGDEATIAAIFNTFAHVSFFSDFAYHNLPPFYPPLFFWIFALVGKIMSWNGVTIAKFASVASFFLIPLLVYWLFKFFNNRDENKSELPEAAPLLFSLFIFILVDVDVMIGKPYEVLAAAAAVLWTIFLVRKARQAWNWKIMVSFGVIGGLIFMTYYLWLIFAAIAIALYALSVAKKEQFVFYGRLLSVAGISLLVASPYLFPLVFAYLKIGTENWQTAIFTPNGLVYSLQALTEFSWRGALMLAGLVAAIYYRRDERVKPALCLFIASYLWWAMGLATVYFFNSPFQEFRGFGLIDRLALGYCAAFAIARLFGKWKEKIGQRGQEVILIVGLLILSLYLPCGTFVDADGVRNRMIKSKSMYPIEVKLFDFLKKDQAPPGLVLNSGLAELPAFVPVNTFIYFGQHNNHPAAHFSDRQAYLRAMAGAKDPAEFYRLAATPYGEITRLILARDKKDYVIYFNLDEPVAGIKQDNLRLKGDLISEKYFTKVFQDDYYAVWDKK
ncbi:MAG: arabinofuranosyltransferase [Patescibacteria group bacterium]|nr:arabinofuranosyltransferase [Patescibacteria group bacterium]